MNRHIIPRCELIKVDDIAGTKTITAIMAFQHRLGLKCDGLVNPAGKTFSSLCSLPRSVLITSCSITTVRKTISNAIMNTEHLIAESIESAVALLHNSRGMDTRILLMQHLPASPPNAIAWGAKVSTEFKKRVIEICKELGMSPDYLMACMAFESSETFAPDILNKAGSKAVGLIQFMPSTAEALHTNSRELSNMTAVQQLEYVREYFLCYKGKLNSLEDIYMAILWPAAIGKDPDAVIFKAGTKVYDQNIGFDRYPKDGAITPRECATAIHQAYTKGISRGYFG